MTWQKHRTILFVLMILYVLMMVIGVVLWLGANQNEGEIAEQEKTGDQVIEALQTESINLIDELIDASE